MRICVVFNPAAKGDQARHFRQELRELGANCLHRPTTCLGDGRRLAAEAVREGMEVIVAAGGDGTINEVLNGIADVPGGLTRTCLGLVPLGTANVFARELGIPLDCHRAWRIIQAGRERAVDVLRARLATNSQTTCRHSVQLAGAGLDARATELVDLQWKKRVSYFAYITAALRALRERQAPITVEADGQTFMGELVLIGNGRFYGGPFTVFPAASLEDGLLDVRVFPKANPRLAIACLFGLCAGRIGSVGRSRDFRVQRLRLSSTSRVPLQLDGECVGDLPAELEVAPRALRVLVPDRHG